MKNIIKVLMVVSAMTFISCIKENSGAQDGVTPMTKVSFDVDYPDAGVETKILHNETAPGQHKITWKTGDQFSMFGIISKSNVKDNVGLVHNYSANRFSLSYGDGSKTFSGSCPDISQIYGSSSGTVMLQHAIYPAVSVRNVDFESVTTVYYHNVSLSDGLSIPETQDGTGWPYGVFFSRTAQHTALYNNPAGGGIKFSLGNTLIRLKVGSEKSIVKVTLEAIDAPVLVGPVTQLRTENNYNSGAGKMWILSGCATKILTVEKEGEALQDDLYFAVRELRKDKTYTFTFTAEDGSTFAKSFKPKSDYGGQVVNLGPVAIAEENWVMAE